MSDKDNRYWGFGSYDANDNSNENLGYTRYDSRTGKVDKFVDNGDGGHSHESWNDYNDYNMGNEPNYSRTDSNSSPNPSTGNIQSNGGGCYLTTACMRYKMKEFEDNCDELQTLRWFRDKFVSKEDIDHYYKTAPIIVEAIEEQKNNNTIYNYIYNNVVKACVVAIKNGDYEFAYNRYKNSILALEEQFARPKLINKLAKTLKLKNIN